MKKKIYDFPLVCIIIAVFFAIHAAAALAGEAQPSEKQINAQKADINGHTGGRYTLYGDLAGALNPQGLRLSSGVYYRNVYNYSEKYDTASAYMQTGLGLSVSPAYGQASVHIEWMPLIFLSLRAQYDHFSFFGSYGSLLSFNSSKESFGDDITDSRNDEETGSGQRFMFQPTLQAKFEKFVFRNQTDVAYYQFSGRGPYFLEQEFYTLMKSRDRLISNRTQILYQAWHGRGDSSTLLVGPFYELTNTQKAEIAQKKIGGLMYWVPVDSVWGLDSPRIIFKSGYHIKDPDRQGEMFVVFDIGFDLNL
jgi:hypothetical protein